MAEGLLPSDAQNGPPLLVLESISTARWGWELLR